MKKLRRATEQGADRSTDSTGKEIVASGNPCPFAPDCRRNWIYINGTETADCAHCYQNLNRSEMARIFAGTA